MTDGVVLVQAHAGEPVLVCGHGGLELALAEPPRWRKGGVLVVDDARRVVDEV